ncbi:MAG: helix-turn-helix domain-containing protein [Bacteroidales bacterium]|jgi:transcriptional regulator with XRE-family HTH domain|nr:helix-turn-helix domain-containing protein [Bacteroidales bacterium]
MELSERIVAIISKYGLSQKKFATMIGVTEGVITQWKTKRQTPNHENLQKISDNFPNISKQWLYEGIGEMFLQSRNIIEPDLFSSNNPILATNSGKQNVNNAVNECVNNIQNTNKSIPVENINNIIQENKKSNKTVEKIIFFYSDKSFEIFVND